VTCEVVKTGIAGGGNREEMREVGKSRLLAHAISCRRQCSIMHEGMVVRRHMVGPRGEQRLFNGSKALRFG
jgi:hypothetical protein